MKRKPNSYPSTSGFTLVELLVVIAIIGMLAALAFMMGPKMLKRGESAKALQNMRQIGPLMMNYATDHSFALPAMRVQIPDDNGGTTEGLHWHQALASLLYAEMDTAKLKEDKWWEDSKPILRNSMYKKSFAPLTLAAWHQGYAMNRQIMQNLGFNGNWGSMDGPNARNIPLSSIPEPSRTALVAPRVNDWHYAGSDLGAKENKGFVVDDKLPILFVDGHIESMRPSEYISRKLDLYPKPKS